MIWCIIITIVLFIVVFVNYITYAHKYNCPIDDLVGNMLLSIIIGAFLISILLLMDDKPQAIDVYRGNTELEIHSINGVPQDTVVVWKNK